MKQASLTDLRRNLSDMLNAVNTDREPLVVTRRRGKPVVMMSLEDYRAMERAPKPKPVSESAAGLWKALSEVDEMAFVPAPDPQPQSAPKPPLTLKRDMRANPVEPAPAFKRHPSR